MPYVDWMIKGPKVTACNCAYGCPCEFSAPPTHGDCEGLEAMEIEDGHFGDVRLDGLIIGASFRWPGAVHLGHGFAQGFIDERADEAQRDAIIKILSGEEQEPTTAFNIYGSTIETEYDPVFAPMTFSCDMEARTAHFVVPGHLDLTIGPLHNPVTGVAQRTQIVQPNGFEFHVAEMGTGAFSGTGDLKFDHKDCYGALFHVAYGPHGLMD
jgi:hypothetical protein